MSLKAFHILFIVISSLMAFGLGAWSLQGPGDPVIAAVGFGAGIALVSYGVWFWRKLKHEGLL